MDMTPDSTGNGIGSAPEAVADGSGTAVFAITEVWSVDDAGIDAFELRASRRILQNLRTLPCERPMWDLIEAQVDAADQQFKAWYDASNGEYRGGAG